MNEKPDPSEALTDSPDLYTDKDQSIIIYKIKQEQLCSKEHNTTPNSLLAPKQEFGPSNCPWFVCTHPEREAIYVLVHNGAAILVQVTAAILTEALVKVRIQTLL